MVCVALQRCWQIDINPFENSNSLHNYNELMMSLAFMHLLGSLLSKKKKIKALGDNKNLISCSTVELEKRTNIPITCTAGSTSVVASSSKDSSVADTWCTDSMLLNKLSTSSLSIWGDKKSTAGQQTSSVFALSAPAQRSALARPARAISSNHFHKHSHIELLAYMHCFSSGKLGWR